MRKLFSQLLTLKTLAVAAAAGVLLLLNPALAHASYDSANLMSDSVFTNTQTMGSDPSAIQSFLVSKNSGLQNYSDVENCSAIKQPYSGTYYPHCGQTVSAATIIYDAAQAYGINPQAIISTMQKEQSLITTPNPTASQINYAMGYGCPDSGSCSFAGFFNQVDNGTWQFKTDMELGSGNNWWGYTPSSYPCNGPTRYYSYALKTNNNVTFYDDYGTGYANFTLPNMTTSTLYCYTPHVYPGSAQEYYSGSYNFVTSFENWFGSTQGPLLIPHPDGTLVRPANSPKVYQLTLDGSGNEVARSVYSWEVFESWHFNPSQITIATQGDLNLMAAADANPTGSQAPMTFREGTLVKDSADPTIYVIQNDGTYAKHSIGSWNNFSGLGYSIGDVLTIPATDLGNITTGAPLADPAPTHPNGTLIRDANSPTVYLLIGGQRHSMTALDYFLSYGFTFPMVKTATAGDDALPISWPINWFAAGTLIRGSSSPTVYITDFNKNKRSFVTYYNFVGLDYSFSNVMVIPDSDIPSTSDTAIGS